MANESSLEALWQSLPPAASMTRLAGDRMFDGGAGYPEPIRRYLAHAIRPGAVLANAVRLRMRGEIRLGHWRRFTAEQVITTRRDSIWCASTRLYGLPVTGFDRMLDGAGEQRWRVLGILPLISGSGADITRSSAGRLAGESMWLPSTLCQPPVELSAVDGSRIVARLPLAVESTSVTMAIGPAGDIQHTSMERWGNPFGEPFAYRAFGGIVEAERTFGDYTIPSRLRIGWYFGSDRFEKEGEFFRCTIESAVYR